MSKIGYIYKLCCCDPSIKEIYIGSTKNMKERKRCHKKACNNSNDRAYGSYVYQFIRKHGGFDNWSMILIETVNYDTKHQLKNYERKNIEQYESSLNCNIPNRTEKEWRKDKSIKKTQLVRPDLLEQKTKQE